MNTLHRTDSGSFIAALGTRDLSALRQIPKSDLHIHSIFGPRLETIEQWLGVTFPRPPEQMSSLDEMVHYAHSVLYPHLMSRQGFEFTARSAIQDALDDGVRILEMSLDMRFIAMYEKGEDGFLSFVSGLMAEYRYRIDFRPEIGISRDRSAEDQAVLAGVCIDGKVFRSIDLYGNETAQPPELYCDLYRYARTRGLKLKVHAGEFAGPDAISNTLDVLEPDELQHGVMAARSLPLMTRLRRDGIRLHVCPSSNVRLGVVRNLSEHPIRTLFDHGVRVTINSDDPAIFGQSVSQEFLSLCASRLFTAEELDAIRLEGLEG